MNVLAQATENVVRAVDESLETMPHFERIELANRLKNIGTNLALFTSYRNPDHRCSYPWDPSPCGYCWSWAHHVDGTKGYEDMMKICPGCEFFKPQGRNFGNPEHELTRVGTR